MLMIILNTIWRQGRFNMTHTRLSRRTMLTGTTALATLVAASREALAQQTVSRSAAAPGAPLPPRREFVIRGANVLSMDPNIGDFAAGDVHVGDGAIGAVAPRIDRTNVQIIEAGNMICMPGFVDTMAKRDWGGARALGLPITLHTSGASPIKLLEEAGLLGSDVRHAGEPGVDQL